MSRNTVWSVADQVTSGLSNILLAIAAAQVGSRSEFGVLSASLVALTSILSISRASLGNSIVLVAGDGLDAIHQATARASAFVLWLAPVPVVLVGLVGWIAGGSQAVGVVALLAISAPVVMVQDLLRFAASALTRSRLAFIADFAWLAVIGLALLVLRQLETPLNVIYVTAAWVFGAVAALSILATSLRSRPEFDGLGTWMRHHREYLTHSIGGTSAVSAANVARVSLIGAVVGPVVVGSLAAGQLIMTPLNLLVALIPFAATPVIARRWTPASSVAPYAGVAVFTSILGLAWWALLAAVPEQTGVAALGEVWQPASELLAPMALLSIGVLVTATALSLLLYLGRPTSYSTVSVVVAATSITAVVGVLARGDGVEALAWAQTSVVALGAGLSWALAVRAQRQLRAELRN